MAAGKRVSRRRGTPLQSYLKWRGARRWLIVMVVAAVLSAMAVVDRRGGMLHQGGDWQRYHGRAFTVLRVVDGDTLLVDEPDGEQPATRVRLWGIDTPEMHVTDADRGPEPLAQEATDFAKRLAEGQRVVLELERHDTRGRYGRLLAYVRLPDGTYLNEQLLMVGLARAEQRFSHSQMDRYVLLERQAKHDEVGLWAK